MVAGGDWLKWRFLRNMLDALEVNRRKLAWKSRFLTAALLSLIVAVALVGGYFVYSALVGFSGGM